MSAQNREISYYRSSSNNSNHLLLLFAAIVTVCISTAALGQINASNEVYIDTSKIVAATVDARINACLGLGDNTRCDASKDAGTVSATINLAHNGATLILGNLTAPNPNTTLISITGNGNTVSCGQSWHTILDASVYASGANSPAVVISGNQNRFSNCTVIGPYFNEPSSALMSDCIQVIGTSTSITDNVVDHNRVQYCGKHGILAQDTSRTKILNNYVSQTYFAGINVNAQLSASSIDGEVAGNWVQDTELQYNVSQGMAGAGNGDINVISFFGSGALSGWLVHDNFVFNTVDVNGTVCNSDTQTDRSKHHGCSEGIQVTEKPWFIHVYNNYVYNTGSEGITLCQWNCSATDNYVANASLNCPGCGGIIQSVQTTGTNIGNTVVSGNTIWNDALPTTPTPYTANNPTKAMIYCMFQTIAMSGTNSITNNNWIGNTCKGVNGGLVQFGFVFNNQVSNTTTISGINLIGNTFDPLTVGAAAVSSGAVLYEDYVTHPVTGKIFNGYNNVYGSALTVPTPGIWPSSTPQGWSGERLRPTPAIFLTLAFSPQILPRTRPPAQLLRYLFGRALTF